MRKKLVTYNTFHDFYALILFLNIFGLGVFGIYPATISLVKKPNFLSEFKIKNEELSSLLVKAQEEAQIQEQLQPYLPALNAAIPDDIYGDRVVAELLVLTAKEGYTLENVSFSLGGENFSIVHFSAEGPFEELGKLLVAIEDSKLSMEITEISMSFSKQDTKHLPRISVDLNVYSLREPINEEE